jgi:hypothetical protein
MFPLYLCQHENSVWVVQTVQDYVLLPNLPIQVRPYPQDLGPSMMVLGDTLKPFDESSYQETIISLEEEVRVSNYASVKKTKLSEFDHRGRLALGLSACETPGFAAHLRRIKVFREERRRVHPAAYCRCDQRVVVVMVQQ